MKLLILCCLLQLLLVHFASTHEWLHHVILDSENHYQVKWHFDLSLESITFNVCVRTKGWIGFGFSPNGGMTGSDLIITWVDAYGRAHLQVGALIFTLS